MKLSTTRNKIRGKVLDLLSLLNNPKPGIHILNGHFLSLDENKGSIVFSNLLKLLIKNQVKIIDFEKAIELIENRRTKKKDCYVAFTFDDGFEECFEKIRPVLNDFNLKVAFFINPGFIDGDDKYRSNFKKNVVLTNKDPMKWEEIEILAKEGHTIGAHTIDHINLNVLDEEILEHQIGKCKIIIEERIRNNCEHFAYPFGKLENFNETASKISKKYYKHVYSQSDYRNYYSFSGQVINRRHFECDWPYRHVLYFLKSKRYN